MGKNLVAFWGKEGEIKAALRCPLSAFRKAQSENEQTNPLLN